MMTVVEHAVKRRFYWLAACLRTLDGLQEDPATL